MNNVYKMVVLLCCFAQSLFVGCIDDPGNYEYVSEDELFPVTIAPLKDMYQVYQGDSLVIIPVFESMDNEGRYQYKWFVSNSDREISLLGENKDFKDVVRLSQKEYTLYFEVKDPKLDVYRQVSSKLSVTANVQNGWYVLKEQDGMTDFDYEGVDNSRVDNVMKNVMGGQQLQGKPLKIVYHPKSYYTESVNAEGKTVVLRNQKAIHVLSEQEFKTIDASTLQLFKNYNDEFYAFPVGAFPGDLSYQREYLFYVDAGKLYSCYIGGVGKFGTSKYIDNYNYDLDLYPGMISNRDRVIVFDRKSNTFMLGTHDDKKLLRFRDESGSRSLTSMDADLVTLLQRTSPEDYTSTGYAIMKNKHTSEKGDYVLLSMTLASYNSNYYPAEIDTIPAGCYMPRAKVWGTHLVSNCIYFGKENQLWVYTNAAIEQREKMIKTFPENEEIAFIQNIEGRVFGDTKAINYLVVATNTDREWKVYFFTIVGKKPENNPEQAHLIKGEGRVRQVMYYNSSK